MYGRGDRGRYVRGRRPRCERRPADSDIDCIVRGQAGVIGGPNGDGEDAGSRGREDDGLAGRVVELAVVVQVPRIGQRVVAGVAAFSGQDNRIGGVSAVWSAGVDYGGVVENGDLSRVVAGVAERACHGDRDDEDAIALVQVEHGDRTSRGRSDGVGAPVVPVDLGRRQLGIEGNDAGRQGDRLAFVDSDCRAGFGDGRRTDRSASVLDQDRFVDLDHRGRRDRRVVGYGDVFGDVDHRRADHRRVVRHRYIFGNVHVGGRDGVGAVVNADALLDEDVHRRWVRG